MEIETLIGDCVGRRWKNIEECAKFFNVDWYLLRAKIVNNDKERFPELNHLDLKYINQEKEVDEMVRKNIILKPFDKNSYGFRNIPLSTYKTKVFPDSFISTILIYNENYRILADCSEDKLDSFREYIKETIKRTQLEFRVDQRLFKNVSNDPTKKKIMVDMNRNYENFAFYKRNKPNFDRDLISVNKESSPFNIFYKLFLEALK